MNPVEILEDIFWVGVVDWRIRDFHGYTTYKGTTYNAYLVRDEKTALFDTVKAPFCTELLHSIQRISDPQRIDYMVVNHVEPDHSGALPQILDRIKPEKLFCSPMGKKALLDHYHHEDWPYEVVETGKSISLGRRTVQFMETRMIHWPDSMFSYIPEERLLISSDGFGQHWATSARFDDEVDRAELMQHAAKYYANILLPYSSLIQKLLDTVGEMGIPIEMIAPDHGIIWRENPTGIIEAYGRWSSQRPARKALVIFDTMWQSTEKMAKALASGLVQEGIQVQLFDLKANHRSDIATEVLDAKALLFGSSTLNNGMMPLMADLLHYIRGLKPQKKLGAAFGSYGWSGEAVKMINEAMEQMKIDVVDPGIRVKYAPTHEDLIRCAELGRKVGRLIKQDPETEDLGAGA